MKEHRRKFLKKSITGMAGMTLLPIFPIMPQRNVFSKAAYANSNSNNLQINQEMFFKISLAQWSLHRSLFNGDITNLDFPSVAQKRFNINAVEYVNQFFPDKATDKEYLAELKSRTDDLGITNVLIMIDNEGGLAESDDRIREKAIENHFKWVEAAQFLGCHSIRVNAHTSTKIYEDAKNAAIDGLGRLTEFAQPYGINIIVENHGGFSSNGKWLTEVIQQVDKPLCGTLPDFGNFCIKKSAVTCEEEYDRYKGVKEMMPFAKGVSAKSYSFNGKGEEETIDYHQMLEIVKKAGYEGYIGIEYEGQGDEHQGILATQILLQQTAIKLNTH